MNFKSQEVLAIHLKNRTFFDIILLKDSVCYLFQSQEYYKSSLAKTTTTLKQTKPMTDNSVDVVLQIFVYMKCSTPIYTPSTQNIVRIQWNFFCSPKWLSEIMSLSRHTHVPMWQQTLCWFQCCLSFFAFVFCSVLNLKLKTMAMIIWWEDFSFIVCIYDSYYNFTMAIVE